MPTAPPGQLLLYSVLLSVGTHPDVKPVGNLPLSRHGRVLLHHNCPLGGCAVTSSASTPTMTCACGPAMFEIAALLEDPTRAEELARDRCPRPHHRPHRPGDRHCSASRSEHPVLAPLTTEDSIVLMSHENPDGMAAGTVVVPTVRKMLRLATREGSHAVKDHVRSVDLGMSMARGGSDRRPRP